MNFQALIAAVTPLFSYPLNITLYPSSNPHAEVMICCHGYGGNATDAQQLMAYEQPPYHLLSFDFPDAYLGSKPYNPHETSFGTIKELLPLLVIMKACVIDAHYSTIHLYGFSAGGGALINALALLNTAQHDQELAAIGITMQQKQAILHAIQQGHIILNSPLKSIEEIIALRDSNAELEILAQRYATHDLRPIDSIKKLTGLSLQILLYIQNPDEVLSNRDDQLFSDALRTTLHQNSTIVRIQVDDGGHNAPHPSLWQYWDKFLEKDKNHDR